MTGTSTTSASYVYDGLGQRVSKTVSGQTTTTFVYDAFGHLMAEYGGNNMSACDTPTCYVTVDHLGSTRLLTDSNGGCLSVTTTPPCVVRYDYQPFGAEISANYGSRTNTMGYLTAPDATGPKYTGQYRDFETTLDWFDVRHMSGAQGRFQSVDPGNAGANAADPQTWNAYAYVGNNPLSYTDPSGQFALAGTGLGLALGLDATNPVGWFIDAGIGLFSLFGIFDHGGGGPPALANFQFPNQVPTATPSGGPLGPGNGDPWNEQAPFGGPGGGLNTGDLFGSGNTNPFVFSFQDSSGSGLANVPAIPGWIVNGVAGAGDKFSFGLTAAIRKHTPGGDATDTNTRSYTVGGWVGTGYQIVFGAALGGTAAAVADGKTGAYFGRGTASVFNAGKVRFGWYWEVNRDAIGLRIGAARGTSWYSHIPFWYPK